MSYAAVAYRPRVVYRALGADVSAGSIPSELGVIRAKSGWTYQLTPTDLLWLARSVQAEGGTRPDATIWTMAQDLALHRGDSFTSLIRAYSQPVNPIWSDPNTSSCQAHPEACTAAKITHRLAVQSTPWSSVSEGVRSKVLAFANATLPNPVPGAVEFANDEISRAFVARHPGSRIVLTAHGNDYIVTPETSGWSSDQVTVAFRGAVSSVASSSLAIVAGIAVLGLGGGFAYWAWRRRRAQHVAR